MKKTLSLFVVLALALSVFIAAVSAQTDLPAIDEAAAADYLGRWYMMDVCDNSSCMNFPDLGVIVTYDVNADNTITVNADSAEPSTNLWYMEDGMAYSIVELSETKTGVSLMAVEENGMLVVMSDDGYVTFSREEPGSAVSEEVVAAPAEADFTGEWHLKGMMIEGNLVPSSLIGSDFVLTVGNETLKLSDGLAEDEAAYIMEEGKLYSMFEGADSEGQPWQEEIMLEIHDDGTLFFYFDPGTEDESVWVFTREKHVVEPGELVSDLTSGLTGGEGGTDLSSLLDNLLPSGEGGFDLNGLISQFTGGEGGLDLNGLISQFTGGENLDLNSLISGLTGGANGEGGLDFGGLMNELTGGEGGEGGLDLGGLMNLFGSGNGQ